MINALESLGVTKRPRYYSREYEHHGTLHCRVILVIARSDRYPDIQSWRVTATGFRHQDTYPLAVRKALRYLCRIFERHLAPTLMRFFPPAIRTPIWEARMRSLERRRHEEGLLYQVATYLASLDQLFDEQANILKKARPASRMTDAILSVAPSQAPFGLSCTLKCEPIPRRVVRVLVLPPCCTLACSNEVVCAYCLLVCMTVCFSTEGGFCLFKNTN